jgi:pyruvate dehydrogenase E2 component (dihydrolipoamide acetyltransferase)
MGEFRMPSLGADMDVGTIVEWLVKPGDAVKRGQIVAVVDTAKAAIEIEAFEAGVVQEIIVGTGVQVPVGAPLAIIGAAVPAPPEAPAAPVVVDSVDSKVGIDYQPAATPPVRHLAHQLGVDLESITGTGPDGHITHDDVVHAADLATAPHVAGAAPKPPRAVGSSPHVAGSDSTSRGQGGRLRVTPRARRIAAERGVDLDAVSGSGAAGAVLARDVDAAVTAGATVGAAVAAAGAPAPAAAPATAADAPPGAPPAGRPAAGAQPDRKALMRTAIANLMSRSNTEIPHYYVTQTMDLGPALTWLRTHNAELPPARRLLPAVLFLRATVLAARAVPDLNGHWVDGALRPAERVDLGIAVATRGGGLVTPAIPDAGLLGIDELMARLADLVGRARRGNLKQAEMAGASITVSSLGETGPDALYGVIFPPQVALVGVGGIVERPWAVDGMLTVRPTCTIALAADHRASDGRTASAFLTTFAHALAHPEEL